MALGEATSSTDHTMHNLPITSILFIISLRTVVILGEEAGGKDNIMLHMNT